MKSCFFIFRIGILGSMLFFFSCKSSSIYVSSGVEYYPSKEAKERSEGKTTETPREEASTAEPVEVRDVNKTVAKVVKEARHYKGTKYKYGEMSKRGTDCSGLICMAYQEVDIKLPRTTSGQSQTGKRKYIGELSEGDLVFFTARPKSSKITHVGMVTQINGDEITFIHASTSRGVMESTLNETYWRERYKMATRIIGE